MRSDLVPTTEVRHYLIGGLSIASAFSLPGYLTEANQSDVVVRAGLQSDVDGPWVDVRRRFRASTGRWYFEASDGCCFLVEEGGRVGVKVPAGTHPDAVADGILHPVLAVLLHQRGVLALHASAVDTGAGAIAFMGVGHSGKSTVAAFMQSQGLPFVTDDICPVDVSARPSIPGGFIMQKLAPDAMRSAQMPAPEQAPLTGDARQRVRVQVRDRPAAALPLAAIYALHRVPAERQSAPVMIEPLAFAAALDALVAQTYRRHYLKGLGQLEANLRACALVAATVPVYRVSFVPGTCDVQTLGMAILRRQAGQV